MIQRRYSDFKNDSENRHNVRRKNRINNKNTFSRFMHIKFGRTRIEHASCNSYGHTGAGAGVLLETKSEGTLIGGRLISK